VKKELESATLAKKIEDVAFVSRAEEISRTFRFCLRTVGIEVNGPVGHDALNFLEWLQREVGYLEGHMMHGRDFAALTCLKALCACLEEAGCDHLAELEVKEPNAYWAIPSSANEAGQKFFNAYWAAGGNDHALIKAAVARAEVCFVPVDVVCFSFPQN
jgi:hypothetical protein